MAPEIQQEAKSLKPLGVETINEKNGARPFFFKKEFRCLPENQQAVKKIDKSPKSNYSSTACLTHTNS